MGTTPTTIGLSCNQPGGSAACGLLPSQLPTGDRIFSQCSESNLLNQPRTDGKFLIVYTEVFRLFSSAAPFSDKKKKAKKIIRNEKKIVDCEMVFAMVYVYTCTRVHVYMCTV